MPNLRADDVAVDKDDAVHGGEGIATGKDVKDERAQLPKVPSNVATPRKRKSNCTMPRTCHIGRGVDGA